MTVGGAFRAPLARVPDGTSDAATAMRLFATGGATPIGEVRFAPVSRMDVGLGAVGAMGRLSVRCEWPFDATTRLIGAAIVTSGMAGGIDSNGAVLARDAPFRFATMIPVAIGVELASFAEAWIGARIGFDYGDGGGGAGGDGRGFGAFSIRGGPLLGLALGLVHIHAVIELAADYDVVTAWRHGSAANTWDGWVLTPIAALRISP